MAGQVFFSVTMSLYGFIAPDSPEDLTGRQRPSGAQQQQVHLDLHVDDLGDTDRLALPRRPSAAGLDAAG